LRHRRREHSPQAPQPSQAAQQSVPQNANPSEGQGQWGEMPAQALAVGARREVPSWPKKP
jgi:magnesium chelatase subunit I